MSEFSIYGLILGVLAAVLLLYLIPRALYKHYQLVKAYRERQERGEEGEREVMGERGVPCQWVNIMDALVVLLLFGVFTAVWWAQRPVEGETQLVEGVIDKETLLGNVYMQGVFVLVIVVVMAWRVNIKEQFGLSLVKHWRGLIWVPLILFISWGVTWGVQIGGYFDYLKELHGESPLQQAVLLLQESDDVMLLSLIVIVACIGAPLSEEVVFRGYLFPVIKGFSGKWVAVLFSGVFFGLIHYNLAGLPTLVVMGCLFAIAYDYTGTIWVPITAHFIFNATTTLVQILSRYYPDLNSSV